MLWRPEQKYQYHQRLNQKLIEAKYSKDIKICTNLVKIIQNSTTNRNKNYTNKKYNSSWYIGECKKARIETLEMQLRNTSDSKKWWKLAKQIRGQNSKIGTHIKS